jgi:hypothetical protein
VLGEGLNLQNFKKMIAYNLLKPLLLHLSDFLLGTVNKTIHFNQLSIKTKPLIKQYDSNVFSNLFYFSLGKNGKNLLSLSLSLSCVLSRSLKRSSLLASIIVYF